MPKKRLVTGEDTLIIRDRLLHLFGEGYLDRSPEYPIERDRVALELGITNIQVGNLLAHLRNEKKRRQG